MMKKKSKRYWIIQKSYYNNCQIIGHVLLLKIEKPNTKGEWDHNIVKKKKNTV